MPIIPSVRDGYEANPIVRKAVDALTAFGGEVLDYRRARALLPLWRGAADLTVLERRAVLSRFPKDCPDIEPGNSGPGW